MTPDPDPTSDDPQALARLALACLDLTRLDDADTEADVDRLCARALTPHGAVAAVCVWPRLAARARAALPPAVRVAAVANFPEGGLDATAAVREVQQIAEAGAQEVDVVLPWRAWLAGDAAACAGLLRQVRRAADGLALKVIFETGAWPDARTLPGACRMALDEGADFLKTSTGRAAVNATPTAAEALLQAIAAHPLAAARAGLKPAGGLRRVADLPPYVQAVRRHLGEAALGPQRLRFGASGLLDDVLRVLDGGEADTVPAARESY